MSFFMNKGNKTRGNKSQVKLKTKVFVNTAPDKCLSSDRQRQLTATAEVSFTSQTNNTRSLVYSTLIHSTWYKEEEKKCLPNYQ